MASPVLIDRVPQQVQHLGVQAASLAVGNGRQRGFEVGRQSQRRARVVGLWSSHATIVPQLWCHRWYNGVMDTPLLRCSRCRGHFPVDFFTRDPACTGRYGRSTWCRTCASKRSQEYRRANPEKAYHAKRRVQLRKNFGMTAEQYDALFEAQRGVCAICQRPESAITSKYGRTNYLSVDHDHTTGAIRGLLCGRCNLGLGRWGDDPIVLRAAAAYVERARAEKEGVP